MEMRIVFKKIKKDKLRQDFTEIDLLDRMK